MNDKIIEVLSLGLLKSLKKKISARTWIMTSEKVMKVCHYLENYPDFLEKSESKRFIKSLKSGNLDLFKLDMVAKLIDKTDFSCMNMKKTGFILPEEIIEKYDISKLEEFKKALKVFEEILKDAEEMYQRGLDGDDISTREYARKLLPFMLYANENNDLWIDLVAKWCEESKEEYEQILKELEEEKVSMSLIPIQKYTQDNYLIEKMERFTYLDISDKANYIRSLYPIDSSLALSLLDRDRTSVLTRICYDIELELIILSMDSPVDMDMKEKLIIEKEIFKNCLNTMLEEEKKYGKSRKC